MKSPGAGSRVSNDHDALCPEEIDPKKKTGASLLLLHCMAPVHLKIDDLDVFPGLFGDPFLQLPLPAVRSRREERAVQVVITPL